MTNSLAIALTSDTWCVERLLNFEQMNYVCDSSTNIPVLIFEYIFILGRQTVHVSVRMFPPTSYKLKVLPSY